MSKTADDFTVVIADDAQEAIQDAVSSALQEQAKADAESGEDVVYVVKLDDSSVDALASAVAGSVSDSQATEVIATLSDDDSALLQTASFSCLFIVLGLFMAFGFVVFDKLLRNFRR